ncbi:MAG: DUF2231 domain-containing protein [Acidobacteriota bacterium]
MIEFPPLPTFDALHPLVIHFPIALLLVAPLFVLVGALLPRERGRAYQITALVLMLCGTLGAFLAVASGEAAARIAERSESVNPVLERHQELAETTRAVFAVLTVAFAALLFAPRWLKRIPAPAMSGVLTAVFLVFYAAGAVVLANTAHNGGRLVHELGVTSAMSPPAPVAAAPATAESERD